MKVMNPTGTRSGRRGATLVMVCVSLMALLSVMALAVDLGMLYVVRNASQRAADAAALAGAESFATSGCALSSNCDQAQFEAAARQEAETVGGENIILGVPAQIKDADVSFNFPTSDEPQITVVVQRTTARGNAVPTIFAKMFGVFSADVFVTATAEAYQSSAYACVAPFLVPNCQTGNTTNLADSSLVNSFCANWSASGPQYYSATELIIPNPTDRNLSTPAPNVVGTDFRLHFGQQSGPSGPAPSQWYLIAFNNNSGNSINQEITQCSPTPIACGDTLDTANGKMVGPVNGNGTDGGGIEERIHANGLGMDQGQDVLMHPTSAGDASTLLVQGGFNNPILSLRGATFPGPSDSIMTLPVYQGQALDPGGDTVTVIGYVELFIKSVNHQGNVDEVDTTVLAAVGCNGSASNDNVSTGGGVPIRLIRTNN